jgi:hypothetical protein
VLRRRESDDDAPVPGREVRLVPVRILTTAGWIVGKLHVAAEWRMISYINHVPEFFTLADVILEGRAQVLPLFTLQRSAIQFVVVETEEDRQLDLPPRNQVTHMVSCLMQNGALHGRVDITRGVRLSDFLSRAKGFVLLRDAHYHVRNPWDERTIEHREPVVLLNPHVVIGVSESAAQS